MKTFDVVALGELLIDFTENGQSAQGNTLFEANPGGAPCNVLAMLGKLGRKCAFVGKVGDDMFGHLLREVAREAGICTDALLTDSAARTTLAFVKTAANGDRDFSFYRNPGADMMLTEDELPADMLRDTRVFHFGTLSMTHEAVRQATKAAVAAAREAGAVISFDPNLRPPLWDSLDTAAEQIRWGLGQADVVKIADNEITFLTSEQDLEKAAGILLARCPNIRLLNVTAGADGSCAYCCGHRVFVPAFRLGGTIETTGAGDTFCACVIHDVLENGLENRTADSLRAMLLFANAAAYLVTTKKGAIRSMPEPGEVTELLKSQGC
ncbi:MAG: carbohydrate kinase [Clostridia bacterium]|nr:carbohydrate kinase [Clostridia bacterium]